MARGNRPLPPLKKGHIADPKTGRKTELQQSQEQSIYDWVSRGVPTIPNDVGGTANQIVLSPNLAPNNLLPDYINYTPFAFVATATSTGLVTIKVKGGNSFLPELPVFIIDTTGAAVQANAGDVSEDQMYVAYYNSALGTGGGFALTSMVTKSATGRWEQVYNTTVSGSTFFPFLNLAPYTELWIEALNWSDSFGRVEVVIQVSSDNGANWQTGTIYRAIQTSGVWIDTNFITLGNRTSGSGGATSGIVRISAFNQAMWSPYIDTGSDRVNSWGGTINADTAWNAIRIGPGAGLNGGGTVKILGMRG